MEGHTHLQYCMSSALASPIIHGSRSSITLCVKLQVQHFRSQVRDCYRNSHGLVKTLHLLVPPHLSAWWMCMLKLEACNSSSIQFQITYVFPFWKCAMWAMRCVTKRKLQSWDCANVLRSLKIGCAILRLACNFWILQMRSAISRLHKFLDCVGHIYEKFTTKSCTYVGFAQNHSNYQSIWLCQWLRYLVAV